MSGRQLLVVDDEFYAVEGITQGIDWSGLGIDAIYEAYDAEEAMQRMSETKIDVLLCDIEMPNVNGLELLQWVKERHPEIETIFLTGHADFSYARKALQIGSFDYLLKPLDNAEVRSAVERALEKIDERRETQRFHDIHKHYSSLFHTHKPLLEGKFWNDFLSRRISPSRASLESLIYSYELSLSPETCMLPILISVELWDKELSLRDEDIMEYALRNVAEEVILAGDPGAVIQDFAGNNAVLFYLKKGQPFRMEELLERCRTYIAACNQYLHCNLSCYVGEPAAFSRLLEMYVLLQEAERSNVKLTNQVLPYQTRKEAGGQPPSIPWISGIAVLFDLGSKADLQRKLEEVFRVLEAEPELSGETLQSSYHALAHMIFQVFHKRGYSLHQIQELRELMEHPNATRSLLQFKAWCCRVVDACIDYLLAQEKGEASVIHKISAYIDNHLKEDISREEIAAYVHFNPAYLSRLFKKEIGVSLTDYIQSKRIERSKELLLSTASKVSDIAEAVGYANIPYFTKLFKKAVGCTPQDYRKTRPGRVD